ncbi:SGNH/GDSL hydrolase family protein [Microbacterium sp. HMH0099]|uniref:SGNH/GDSL hydrolase family protein n=1 Tax=Microbacterium sp. HMH0099 TaxID=3414026 RepID=UPI003BF6303E
MNKLDQGILDAHKVLDTRLSEEALTATISDVSAPVADARQIRNARALRPFYAKVKEGSSRTYIFGHSVVFGSGAGSADRRFANIVSAAIKAVDAAATVTIDGNSSYTSTQLLAKVAGAGTSASFTSLTIYMGLLNDYYYGVDPATTKSNLLALVAKMKSIQPASADVPAFLILLEWLRGDIASPAFPWTDYVKAAREVADGDPTVALLDLGTLMGPGAPDKLGLYAADDAHPSNLGHAIIAQHVNDLLLPSFATAAGGSSPSAGMGELLGATHYKPASVTSRTTTSTGLVNVDDTNPEKVGVVFTAKSSATLVRLTGCAFVTSGGSARWGLRFMAPSAAAAVAGEVEVAGSPGGQYLSVSRHILVTGLTPGQQYGLTWAHKVNNSSYTATFVAGAHVGAAVMEIYDAAGVSLTS